MSPSHKGRRRELGRHTARGLSLPPQGQPEFWRAEWPKYAMGAGVLVGLIVVVVLTAVML